MTPSSPTHTDPSRSADALRESEEVFRLMVESVKDYAIFMLDPHGRVQTWNDGARLLKGYEPAEIIGKHISTFYVDSDVKDGRPQRLLAAALREGRVEDEGWRKRKDGTLFWADVVITALKGADGQLKGFTKVTRDLTARRETEEALRESEERFRLLVESVKDYSIFMLDPEGRVATWNAGAERIKGYKADEIIGQHFSKFFEPQDVESGKGDRELRIARETGKFEEEGWRIRKDGARFWANVVIEPVRKANGELKGYVKITRDLTERRKADSERLRLAQAEEAVRLRDEFLSIASHELKTPLSALQLQLEAALKRMQDEDPKLRERIQKAYKGGARLADLIEALLDVSRIATGKFTLAPSELDLGKVVEEVVERYREQAVRVDSEIALDVEPRLIGSWDRLRVEQVVTNLLGNALKYAAGSKVEISVRKDRNQAVIAVADHGPGIPQSEWARIFERFERAASMRNYGGLGLGLYVARQLTEAHGGSIAVEAVQPQGVKFVVRLPTRTVGAGEAVAG